MFINRLAENKLKNLLNNRKVIILLGARQVEKTTLIKRILHTRQGYILNLDIEVDKERFLTLSHMAPYDAIKSLKNPLF